jgi:hypothetical protein
VQVLFGAVLVRLPPQGRPAVVNAEDVPQELIDILDARAGREHSRTGSVVAALAEILNLWEVIREEAPTARSGDTGGGR